jgi:hypothetical protein
VSIAFVLPVSSVVALSTRCFTYRPFGGGGWRTGSTSSLAAGHAVWSSRPQVTMYAHCIIGLLLAASVAAEEQDTHNPVERLRLANALDLRLGHHDDHHLYHVKIQANISSFHGAGEWLEVEWSGVEAPGLDDWVAVVTAATEDVQASTPIKYKLASSSRDFLETGSGSATCACLLVDSPLPNIRLLPFLACHLRVPSPAATSVCIDSVTT